MNNGHASHGRLSLIDLQERFPDAYCGGERRGGKRGPGALGKTPFIASVELNREGRPMNAPEPSRRVSHRRDRHLGPVPPRARHRRGVRPMP